MSEPGDEIDRREVLLDFSIFPVDQGESLSRHVSRAIDIVVRSGLPYRVGPMGTTLEGTYADCMKVVSDCFADMSRECKRVVVQVKVDYRSGREGALDSKIASVERRLGRKLRT
jgi:uncharacterized protein (TIGR00106 family)